MARGEKHLTAKDVEGLKTPGKYGDGGGLYLLIDKAGSKRWLFLYQLRGGPRRTMGLGGLDKVSLAGARDARDAAKKLIGQGVDPIDARKAEDAAKAALRAIPFFRVFAQEVADAVPLKQETSRKQWKHHVGPKCCPALQDLRIDEITTRHIVDTLKRDWTTTPTKMASVRERIERVLDAARVDGFIEEGKANPARWKGHLEIRLGKQRHKATHFKALPYEQIGSAYARVAATEGLTARLLEFAILTAVRPSEARQARWGEFDFDAALWRVPDENIKTAEHLNEPFIVPLSTQALAVLRTLVPPGPPPGDKVPVFASQDRRRRGAPLCPRAVTALLERMNLKPIATGHGFRSTFRDWAGDCTSHPRELIEQCLSHKVGSGTELAYRRRDALSKRTIIMEEWADRCTDPSRDKVVAFSKARSAG